MKDTYNTHGETFSNAFLQGFYKYIQFHLELNFNIFDPVHCQNMEFINVSAVMVTQILSDLENRFPLFSEMNKKSLEKIHI